MNRPKNIIDQEIIDIKMKEFLEKGNKVQQIPVGVSGIADKAMNFRLPDKQAAAKEK